MGGQISVAQKDEIIKTVNKNTSNTMISKSQKSATSINGSQLIKIKGIKCQGNINFSNISQKFVSQVDVQKMMTDISQTEFQNIIKNTIEQSAQSVQKTISALSGSLAVSQDIQRLKNETINETLRNYSYNDFKEDVLGVSNFQELIIEDVESKGGDCNFSNISQNLQMDILSKKITENIIKNFDKVLTQNNISQESSSKQLTEAKSIISDFFKGLTGLISAYIIPLVVGGVILVAVIGIILWKSGALNVLTNTFAEIAKEQSSAYVEKQSSSPFGFGGGELFGDEDTDYY